MDPMSSSLYEIPVTKIDGTVSTLGEYAGKALLIVNVASECGYTFHYEGLEAIWKKYRDQGLVVIGFPSNDFGAQEPGSDEEIREFCSTKFGVTFPLYSKIVVTGEDKHPLYAALTASKPEAVIHDDSPLIQNLLAGN